MKIKIKIKETVEIVHLLKFWSLRFGTFPTSTCGHA